MKHILKESWNRVPITVRRICVFVIGWLVVLGGIAMLALPGPGWAAIFLGFAILATEFTTAKNIKDGFVSRIKKITDWYKNRNKKPKS